MRAPPGADGAPAGAGRSECAGRAGEAGEGRRNLPQQAAAGRAHPVRGPHCDCGGDGSNAGDPYWPVPLGLQ